MLPKYFKYIAIGIICIGIILYLLTLKWNSAKRYMEVFGIAWVVSWIVLIGLSYILLKVIKK